MLTMHMPSKTPPISTRAPAAAPSAAGRFPGEEDTPRLDDRLVRPEAREERVGGRPLIAAPAGPPHGDAHCQLDGEAVFHIRPGYVASTDLLTRVDVGSDFATDTSIRKEGVDPATGDRHLEEVVFEVVHEQSLRDVTERAERLSARGLRRIFALFVKRREVAEWSLAERSWRPLPPEASIEDECLIRPLPVRALLDRAEGRNAVARVLLEESNPVLEQARQEARSSGHLAGLAEGHRKAIERLCELLAIDLTGVRRDALTCASAPALEALADDIARARAWPS